ncbi:MAG: CinA family protein, partial [Clostridia bacterium]|nr:CinA family protein [Clostridia bacterium]MDY6185379.1 CinA family protein [Eubacteriales bacterium]
VTYANEAKIKYLGVSADTIAKYGVVSEEVAREMAVGVARANGAEIGVGVSGIAGPSGGTPRKPIGMVCFGFSTPDGVFTATKQFGDLGRQAVRAAACDFVFETLVTLLKA